MARISHLIVTLADIYIVVEMTMLSRIINLTQCFKLQTSYGGLLINNHHILINAMALVLKVL
jgi:hypothetical protein